MSNREEQEQLAGPDERHGLHRFHLLRGHLLRGVEGPAVPVLAGDGSAERKGLRSSGHLQGAKAHAQPPAPAQCLPDKPHSQGGMQLLELLNITDLKSFSYTLSEFASRVKNEELLERKLTEYGKVIIPKNAVSTCLKFFSNT